MPASPRHLNVLPCSPPVKLSRILANCCQEVKCEYYNLLYESVINAFLKDCANRFSKSLYGSNTVYLPNLIKRNVRNT